MPDPALPLPPPAPPGPDGMRPPCRGLVAGWRLGREGATPLTEAEAGAAVARGETGLWLHFDLVDSRARAFIAALPALPEAAQAALLETDPPVRLEETGEALVGALPDLHFDQDDMPGIQAGVLHIALTPGILVTARRHPLRGVHEALQRPSQGGPPEALAWLLHSILAELGRVLAELGRRLGQVEDAMLQPGGLRRRADLAELRREALRLSRHFAPLAEVAETLRDEQPAWCDAPALRRAARHALAVLRALDGLLERARLAQEALDSLSAEETNRRLFVLSAISAAMLPATLVAGIFGMNVGGLPGTPGEGTEAAWGFGMAMWLIAASIGGTLASLRLFRML